MRVPDSLLQNSYLINLNKNRSNLAKIQTQLTTQRKVNKPSDNPLSNSRIMRMQDQLSSINTYKSNVSYSRSIIDDSILSMEAIMTEMQNVQVKLTGLNSAIVNDDLSSFAQSIDASLEIILELANSQFNGQYNFAGTEGSSAPFYYDKNDKIVTTPSDHIGNDRVVKISSGITQKINISGKELFQSVFAESGNLDSTAGIGVPQTTSDSVYDADGNEYTLNMNYTMTAANTYDLDYTILDENGNVVQNQTVGNILFNPDSGEFESIDGDSFGEIHVKDSANKIDFVIDINGLSESNNSSSFISNLSQKADIFNTLISIRENLRNGERPSATQVDIVNDFYQHLLNNLSRAGGISNKLQSTEEILINQEVEISNLLSLERDVDIAQALIDLESAQYSLDIGYKISSMILPRSLLDYM